MGDLNLLTRGYCADLQLPEGPERLKCYKKLCSIGRRKGSLEHTGKHARWFRCCVFVALVHRSISGFWKDQTLAPVHCRARPGPRVLCFLCQVCLEALGTPAREGALEQCRDPLSSGSGNSIFRGGFASSTRPLASLQRANRLPCFGCPHIPAGRGVPSLTRGVRAWLPPSCSGSPLWRVPQGLAFSSHARARARCPLSAHPPAHTSVSPLILRAIISITRSSLIALELHERRRYRSIFWLLAYPCREQGNRRRSSSCLSLRGRPQHTKRTAVAPSSPFCRGLRVSSVVKQ